MHAAIIYILDTSFITRYAPLFPIRGNMYIVREPENVLLLKKCKALHAALLLYYTYLSFNTQLMPWIISRTCL